MTQPTKLMEMTIRDIFKPLFRQKILIIIIIILVSLGSFIGAIFSTPKYQAKVLIHIKGVGQVATDVYRGIGAYRIHLTQMAIVRSTPVLKRTVFALNLHNRPLDYEKKFCHPLKKHAINHGMKDLKKNIKKLKGRALLDFKINLAINRLRKNVETVLRPNTDIFEIVVTDYSAKEAIAIANVISRSFIIFDHQQQLAELTLKYGALHPTIRQIRDSIRAMSYKLSRNELSDLEAIGSASVKIIEQATSNNKPIGKPKRVVILTGLFLSIFIAIGVAYVLDYTNQTFRTPQEVEQKLKHSVFGSIPKKSFLDKQIINVKSKNRLTSFYNELAGQVYIELKKEKLSTVMFTSLMESKDNATVLTNIALSMQNQVKCKILCIDVNFTKPAIHSLLKIDQTPGLADVIENKSDTFANSIQSLEHGIDILTAGTTNAYPLNLIEKSSIKTEITKLKKKYDFILFSCSAKNNINYANLFSTYVDGAIFTIDENKDRSHVIERAIDKFNKNDANIIGTILYNRIFVIPKLIYNKLG